MIAREKDKKAKQYKKNGCVLLLMKKKKSIPLASITLNQLKKKKTRDHRPKQKNITSISDKG